MAVVDLLLALRPGEGDFVGIDDHDEVAAIHMRSEGRLVLAAQQGGDVGGEATEDYIGGIDDMPVASDLAGFGAIGAHGTPPLLSMGLVSAPPRFEEAVLGTFRAPRLPALMASTADEGYPTPVVTSQPRGHTPSRCNLFHMSRTNIDIDDELVEIVMERYQLKTKREAVDYALRNLAGQPMTKQEALAMCGSMPDFEVPKDRPFTHFLHDELSLADDDGSAS